METNQREVTRRRFLKDSGKAVIGLLITGATGSALLTACSSIGRNSNKSPTSTESLVELGSLSEIERGPFPLKVEYEQMTKDAWADVELKGFVYINKAQDDKLLIMSPICTHLGCTVPKANDEMQKKGITFFCPCHYGEYDDHGNNIGGPPPRPFDLFEYTIREDKVYINPRKPIRRAKK